jgi:acyl carrier protein
MQAEWKAFMTTFDRIAQLLRSNFEIPDGNLTPESPLASLDIDSLGMIEILFAVEDQFGLKIPRDDRAVMAGLSTVQDLVNYVDNQVALQGRESSEPPAP